MKLLQPLAHFAGSLPRSTLLILGWLTGVAVPSDAAQLLLGEMQTTTGPSYQYVAGKMTLDLSSIPAETPTFRYIKIANDPAAAGDAPAAMPEFQLTLERDTDNDGTYEVSFPVNVTAAAGGLAFNYLTFTLSPDPAAAGGFAAEKVYTVFLSIPGGGWAATHSPGKERLRIGIKNNAAVARTYVGVAGETSTEAEAGWIAARSSIDFGELQRGSSASEVSPRTVTVTNLGTGPLTITTISNPSLPAPGSPFKRAAVSTPLILPPLASQDIEVEVNPSHSTLTVAAAKTASLTFASDAANTPSLAVNLAATFVDLEIKLLIDVSGSMGFKPGDASYTVPPPNHQDSRIYQAKQAGAQFQFLLAAIEGNAARVGLATFPEQATPPKPGTAKTVVSLGPLASVGGALSLAWSDSLPGSLQAPQYGDTPMSQGLWEAYGDTPSSFLSGKWSAGTLVHRAVIMLSDGYNETAVPPAARSSPMDWVNYLSTVVDPNYLIRLYTIAYGTPGAGSVDHVTLQKLADSGQGGMVVADPADPAKYNKKFRDALIRWRKWAEIADPKGTLIKGGPLKQHSVCIDDDVERVAFVVDWKKMAAGSVDFQLVGPSGPIAIGSPDVQFQEGVNWKAFVVRGPTLKGAPGAETWTFILTGGAGLANGESLEYSYAVIAKSRTQLTADPAKSPWLTLKSQLIEFALQLAEPSSPRPTSIRLEYDLPTTSYARWLSSTQGIRPEWLLPPGRGSSPALAIADSNPFVVNQVDLGPEASMLDRKIYALTRFADRPFVDPRTNGVLELVDNGTRGDRVAGDGVYSGLIDAVKVDGVASVRAVLDSGAGDSCMQREYTFDRHIGVQLSRALLARQLAVTNVLTSVLFPEELQALLAKPPRERFTRSAVLLKPADEAGNPVGPGQAAAIHLTLQGAEALGPLVDMMDGSYQQVVDHPEGQKVTVAVRIGDVSTADPGEPPTVSIRREGAESVVLSWIDDGALLEEAATGVLGSWKTALVETATDGRTRSAKIPTSGGTRFFRLRR